MKIKLLFAIVIVLALAACKKDAAKVAQPVLEFDINGTHHSFVMDTAKLQIVDTGSAAGKFLVLFTGYGALPQVRLIITDRTFDRNAPCFPTGFYPNLAYSSACNDTIPNNFCLGFSMQYVDTGFGHIATLDVNDSTSALNLVSCAGTPSLINGTFNCTLIDPNGVAAPRTVTNGKLSNMIYTR